MEEVKQETSAEVLADIESRLERAEEYIAGAPVELPEFTYEDVAFLYSLLCHASHTIEAHAQVDVEKLGSEAGAVFGIAGEPTRPATPIPKALSAEVADDDG